MVCNHCVRAVGNVLSAMQLTPVSVVLGRAEITGQLTDTQIAELSSRLEENGFELIMDPAKEIAESIKREVIFMVRGETPPPAKLSEYLASGLHRDYRSLSRIFSESEGRTIESYVILQKIERAKELLLDGELNVSEIAWRLGYSGVAHLSRQFKDITGMTPTDFRRDGRRLPLNEV